VFATGDAATGTQVLEHLYAVNRDRPSTTDLAALWAQLGISLVEGRAVLDDGAPLATLRVALTAPDQSAPAAPYRVFAVRPE
jgi:hypothetical protein